MAAMNRPKLSRAVGPRIEILEARISPATLNIVNGEITYTAGARVGNLLTLSISGANYVLADVSETITLSPAAITAGFTGSGTNTVQGPNTAVTSLVISLGDQNDQFLVQGLTDPLTAHGDAGAADS